MGLAVPTVRTGRALAAALDEIEGDPTAVVRAVTRGGLPGREPGKSMKPLPGAGYSWEEYFAVQLERRSDWTLWDVVTGWGKS